MEAMKQRAACGLDNLELTGIDARGPGPGEIQFEVTASSLNFHDYVVVPGLLPTEMGRIPMSDGAGIVTAVGDGVHNLRWGIRCPATSSPTGQTAHPVWKNPGHSRR